MAVEKGLQFFNLGNSDGGFSTGASVYEGVGEDYVLEFVIFRGFCHYLVALGTCFSWVGNVRYVCCSWAASVVVAAFARCVTVDVLVLSAIATYPAAFVCVAHGFIPWNEYETPGNGLVPGVRACLSLSFGWFGFYLDDWFSFRFGFGNGGRRFDGRGRWVGVGLNGLG